MKQPVVPNSFATGFNLNTTNLDELKNALLPYRGIEFVKKDLIDMRSVIH